MWYWGFFASVSHYFFFQWCLHQHLLFSFINPLIPYSVCCRGMNHQYITFHQHYHCSFHINNKLVVVKFLELIRSKIACTFFLILVQLLKMQQLVLCPKSYISHSGLFLLLFFHSIHKMRENENLLMLSISSSSRYSNWGKILSHSVLVGLRWALTLRFNSGRVFTIQGVWRSIELPFQIMIVSRKNYLNVA